MTNTVTGGPEGRNPDQSRRAEDVARDLREEAREHATGVRDATIEHGRARAESAKDGFAGEVSSVGVALRRASSELRDGSPQSRAFSSLADSVTDLADGMRDRNAAQMIDELSDFGRRNPAAFLGGAALLGFAAVRMARASRETPRDAATSSHGGEPRSGGVPDAPPLGAPGALATQPPASPPSVAGGPASPPHPATGAPLPNEDHHD